MLMTGRDKSDKNSRMKNCLPTLFVSQCELETNSVGEHFLILPFLTSLPIFGYEYPSYHQNLISKMLSTPASSHQHLK